jgi:hypothetical protein
VGYLVTPGDRPEFVPALPRRFEEADPDLVDGEGVMAQRSCCFPWAEQLRALLQLADLDQKVGAALAEEPQAPRSAAGLDVADQPGSLKIGEELLGAPQATTRKVDRVNLPGGKGPVLGERGDDLDRRLGHNDAGPPIHASLQARGRSESERCLASAEAIAVAPSAIGAVEPVKL